MIVEHCIYAPSRGNCERVEFLDAGNAEFRKKRLSYDATPITRGCRVGGSDASRRVAKISSTLRTSRTSDAAKLTQE